MTKTANLANLISFSGANAFKNNRIYTGSFTISGNTVAGTNLQTLTVPLLSTPDMVDIVFNGPANGTPSIDPRPANGWFKVGNSYDVTYNTVWVPTNNAGGGNPSSWSIYASISGTTLTLNAVYVQQFTTVEALTATSVSYRMADYSIF